MLEDNLKNKKDLLKEEIDTLIEDFRIKRQKYNSNHIKMCWVIEMLKPPAMLGRIE